MSRGRQDEEMEAETEPASSPRSRRYESLQAVRMDSSCEFGRMNGLPAWYCTISLHYMFFSLHNLQDSVPPTVSDGPFASSVPDPCQFNSFCNEFNTTGFPELEDADEISRMRSRILSLLCDVSFCLLHDSLYKTRRHSPSHLVVLFPRLYFSLY